MQHPGDSEHRRTGFHSLSSLYTVLTSSLMYKYIFSPVLALDWLLSLTAVTPNVRYEYVLPDLYTVRSTLFLSHHTQQSARLCATHRTFTQVLTNSQLLFCVRKHFRVCAVAFQGLRTIFRNRFCFFASKTAFSRLKQQKRKIFRNFRCSAGFCVHSTRKPFLLTACCS